jgi:hypothetical protein
VPAPAERREGRSGERSVDARNRRRLGEPPLQPARREPLRAGGVFDGGERGQVERELERERANLTR